MDRTRLDYGAVGNICFVGAGRLGFTVIHEASRWTHFFHRIEKCPFHNIQKM